MKERQHGLVVAVFDDLADQRELVQIALQLAGHRVALCQAVPGAMPPESVQARLHDVQADVVIWDLSPALADRCDRFRRVLESGAFGERRLVVTTSHEPRVRTLLGGACTGLKILMKPYTLTALLGAVLDASARTGPAARG